MTAAPAQRPLDAPGAGPLLRVEDLVVSRGGRAVARLGRLELAAGETALLMGPSGSGKTSLLLAIAGLATATGVVRIAGEDLSALSNAARDRFRGRRIGFVFQDIHLLAGLSTLDNLLLAPFAAGVSQDRLRARRLLDEVGLGAKADQSADTLSRGEAQRAAIARAMLLKPALILADEPTASLDDDNCDLVARLLLEAAAETGAALLIATHDRRLSALIPTRAAVERVS